MSIQLNKTINIRLSGEDIAPGILRSHDLAKLIINIESAIATIVVAQNNDIEEKDVVVGLSDVDEGSLSLCFDLKPAHLALAAYIVLTSAINQNSYHSLPVKSVIALQDVLKLSKSRNCTIEFRNEHNNGEPLATLTQTSEISQEQDLLVGQTTIYGEVIQVGGVSPKVVIDLGYKRLYCDAKREIVTLLAQKLYKRVGLRGKATWNIDENEITKFNITDLLKYERVPLTKAFAIMREYAEGFYDDIDDVENYIYSLRHGRDPNIGEINEDS